MKTKFFFFFLLAGLSVTFGQSPDRRDSTKKIMNPENFSTDSARRGNEIYQGGKNNKSNGYTLNGRKRQYSKPNSGKLQPPNKNKHPGAGVKPRKSVSLAMNGFKA